MDKICNFVKQWIFLYLWNVKVFNIEKYTIFGIVANLNCRF